MAELLDSVELMKPLRRGDIVEGIVMSSDPDGVLLNIGHKAEGIVPPGEMRSLDREAIERLNVGDEVLALVVKGESSDGAAILSIDRAVGEMGWKTLEKALDSGGKVDGKILGFNRGGAIVESEGVQAFVPISQLVSISRNSLRAVQQPEAPAPPPAVADSSEGAEAEQSAGEGERQEAPPAGPPPEHPDIGKVLELKVLEVNRSRNRAILSERQAMQEVREERKARLIQELTEGEVRKGEVTGISSFGVFVDLGGADGLVHISELSWDTVRSPEEVVKVGDELEVYVLRVDAEKKKIALSLKRLQPEPWETINDRYEVGDIVDATVTKLTDFGAFARVTGSVEGLVHISELTSRMINHPREVLKEGDAVRLKVLRIEPERRRLGLSLRQAEDEEGPFQTEEDLPAEDQETVMEAEEEGLQGEEQAAPAQAEGAEEEVEEEKAPDQADKEAGLQGEEQEAPEQAEGAEEEVEEEKAPDQADKEAGLQGEEQEAPEQAEEEDGPTQAETEEGPAHVVVEEEAVAKEEEKDGA
jgi:small subunit ribosomal protein S1